MKKVASLLLSFAMIFVFMGCEQSSKAIKRPEINNVETVSPQESKDKDAEIKQEKTENTKETEENKDKAKDLGSIKIHYIDVGQGDCELIHVGNAAMLIDAGNAEDGDNIVRYIKDQGIKKLDYLILTHPHADHIGGAKDVVNALEIDKIIMPKVSHNSKTFEELLLAIKAKGLEITSPIPGHDYKLGEASFNILAPNSSSYDNLNNYSVVTKVNLGKTSFLFAGDAESASENETISAGFDLKSDILKVGHHGSNTSTSKQFLKAVNPKYAVISCGKGNKYGHPTQATLNNLAASSVEIYRTDDSGTIIATSDGERISFDKKASPVKQNAPPKADSKNTGAVAKPIAKPLPKPQAKTPVSASDKKDETVYVTSTGKKYHREGCQFLKKSKIPMSLKKAKGSYEPCSKCNPPT